MKSPIKNDVTDYIIGRQNSLFVTTTSVYHGFEQDSRDPNGSVWWFNFRLDPIVC
jgi:hypothetical protein